MKTLKLFIVLSLLFFSFNAFALPVPKVGKFQIKEVADKNILYITHTEDKGHISNSLIKLIQFYLLKESDDYKVVFPQFSMESRNINGNYYAIGFKGTPKASKEIKTTQLKGGLFASFIYKGNYKNIGSAIRGTFQKVLKTGKYVPHDDEEIRLLYWNSIDDNHPKDLITEIQVRVVKLP
jgi:effector-binding domain-containing protein